MGHFFGDSILKFAEFWVFRTDIEAASAGVVEQIQSVLLLEMGQGRSRRFGQSQYTHQ